MDVTIIGPGRVGGALALALRHAGHVVRTVAGDPTSTSTRRFLDLLPEAALLPVDHAARDVDLVLVTTPDDVIAAVAGRAAAAESVHPGQRWVHTAGGHGVEPLAAAAAAGAGVAACHPAMTFPDPEAGARDLPGTSWAVTAEEPHLGWARLLVLELRGRPVTLAGTDRTLYHAGLAVGSNATTAVVSLARDLLLGAGIEDPAPFLTPLATASARGGATRGVAALTGPVQRGDVGTVTAHLHELRRSYPEAMSAYVMLSRLVLGQAVRGGLDRQLAERIEQVLDELGP